jgi:tetratricopeptide (TPR) repeat protein
MTNEFVKRRAVALWKDAQKSQLSGQLAKSIELYRKSIRLCPTAEAHTFLGWAMSFQSRYIEAIRECKAAIQLDPAFGNPYNDIGSYLATLGRLDEAVGWLERAKKAPRYIPKHFPYMNLGRVYAAKGLVRLAIQEYEFALRIRPGEPYCLAAIDELKRIRN